MNFSKAAILMILLSFSVFANLGAISDRTITENSLHIQRYNTLPDVIEPGDQGVILMADLIHSGSRTYYNVTVDVLFQHPFEPVSSTYEVGRINPLDTYTVTFRFNVKDVDPGVYKVPVEISYVDSINNIRTSYKEIIYIQVSSVPRLEFYDISTKDVSVGDYFEVDFYLNNFGSLSASDVLATISIDPTAHITWIPDKKTISMIDSGEEYILTFKGKTTDDTVAGSYMGTLMLDYSGQTLTNEFVLPITGKPELRLAGVNTDEDAQPGKKISLSVQLENVGLGDARSAKVRINDQSIEGVLDSYIGTVDVDDTGTAIFDVILMDEGLNHIPLILEYQDKTGRTYTSDMMITVYNYPIPGDGTAFIGAFFIAAVVVFYFYRKRKKHDQLKKVR